MKHIVISIKPKWADLIRSGAKTVELRRGFPCLPSDSIAYLYESSPVSGLTALLGIGAVYKLPVAELWNLLGEASCVDRPRFEEYFAGCVTGYGVHIAKCVPLGKFLSLAELRSRFAFTAPQSWAYASAKLINSLDLTG